MTHRADILCKLLTQPNAEQSDALGADGNQHDVGVLGYDSLQRLQQLTVAAGCKLRLRNKLQQSIQGLFALLPFLLSLRQKKKKTADLTINRKKTADLQRSAYYRRPP